MARKLKRYHYMADILSHEDCKSKIREGIISSYIEIEIENIRRVKK